jgi:type II secretory pathway component PulF
MATFAYKAYNAKGGLITGALDGEDADGIKRQLAQQNLIPVSVVKNAKNFEFDFFKQKLKTAELVLFTKQFYTLFKAGMGMDTILSTLGKQATNKSFCKALETIRADIAQGSSLVMAFKKHPLFFNELYVNMLASGEEAGILEDVLGQLGNLLEKDSAVQQGVKGALLYPKIVVGALCLATVVLMTVVMPEFVKFFANFNAKLPLPTRIMIATSDFMVNYWYVLIIASVGSYQLYNRYYATPKGHYLIDKLSYKIPIFGELSLKVANARFANILASLYRSGVPVTKALNITGRTIGNEAFMRDVRLLQAEVERGRSIADAMRELTYFSIIIVEATAIGERSGALDNMLKSIGEHYDMEIGHMVKNLSTLIEPIMLTLVGAMVALFALAIFLPIFGLSNAMIDHQTGQ